MLPLRMKQDLQIPVPSRNFQPASWAPMKLVAQTTLAAICLMSSSEAGFGQSLPAGIEIEDFVVEDYFPDVDQRKSVLYGASAKSSQEGFIEINGLQLDLFQEDGSQNLRVETEWCEFNEKQGEVESDREVRITRAEGRFSLSGAGFEWSKDTGVVRVTRNVQTQIDRSLLKDMRSEKEVSTDTDNSTNAGAEEKLKGNQEEPLRVTSNKFEFDTEKRLAVYLDNVRAIDGQGLNLQCDRLEVHFTGESDEIEQILGLGNVGIEWKMEERTGRAQSDQVTYYAESGEGVVALTGNPRWFLDQDSGSAERIIARPSSEEVVAEGSASLVVTLPEQEGSDQRGMLSLNLQGQEEVKPTATGPQKIEVTADRYRYLSAESSQVIFEGAPELNDLASGWKLSGEKLLFELDQERRPKSIEATHPAQLKKGTTVLRGSVLRGNLQDGRFEVLSDDLDRVVFQEAGRKLVSNRMSFNNQDQTLQASGEIEMEVEGVVVEMGIPDRTNSDSEKDSTPAKPQTLLVKSDQFQVEGAAYIFKGSASVKGVDWSLTAEWMKLTTSESTSEDGSNELKKLNAQGKVVLEQQGTKLFGDEMVYDPSSQEAILKGNASMQSEKFRLTRADQLIWNGKTGKVRSEGSSWLRGTIANRIQPK